MLLEALAVNGNVLEFVLAMDTSIVCILVFAALVAVTKTLTNEL